MEEYEFDYCKITDNGAILFLKFKVIYPDQLKNTEEMIAYLFKDYNTFDNDKKEEYLDRVASLKNDTNSILLPSQIRLQEDEILFFTSVDKKSEFYPELFVKFEILRKFHERNIADEKKLLQDSEFYIETRVKNERIILHPANPECYSTLSKWHAKYEICKCGVLVLNHKRSRHRKSSYHYSRIKYLEDHSML